MNPPPNRVEAGARRSTRRPPMLRKLAAALGGQRARLTICLALYGGSLGGSALLVNQLSRTKIPNVPQHMPADVAITLSAVAGLACAAATVATVRILTGEGRDQRARGIFAWLVVGFLFGVISAPLIGATLPMSTMIHGLTMGVVEVGDLPIAFLTALTSAPAFAITEGVLGLYTALLAGALFGAGAWLIDTANYAANRLVSAYAPYAMSIALSALFYGISTLGPPETLARLG